MDPIIKIELDIENFYNHRDERVSCIKSGNKWMANFIYVTDTPERSVHVDVLLNKAIYDNAV